MMAAPERTGIEVHHAREGFRVMRAGRGLIVRIGVYVEHDGALLVEASTACDADAVSAAVEALGADPGVCREVVRIAREGERLPRYRIDALLAALAKVPPRDPEVVETERVA